MRRELSERTKDYSNTKTALEQERALIHKKAESIVKNKAVLEILQGKVDPKAGNVLERLEERLEQRLREAEEEAKQKE